MADEIIKLTRPIQAHGEQVTELTLREPNGAIIEKCGFPFSFEQAPGGATRRAIDTRVVGEYISELAGIPRSSVGLLAPTDWTRAMGALVGFFADAETPDSS